MSTAKYTYLNIIGSIIPIVLSLITIPFYLNLIGAERYGVLAIVWIFLGYFGLFDFGLGRATAKIIAEISKQSQKRLRSVLSTALVLNLGMGIAGSLLLFFTAGFVFETMLKTQSSTMQELRASIPLLALCLPIITVTGVLNGALMGLEKFFQLNVISVISASLTQLLPIIAAVLFSPTLPILLGAVLTARFITLLVLLFKCLQIIGLDKSSLYSRELAADLFNFGKWIALSSLISPLMTSLDRLLIGGLIGIKEVTFYTIPFQLAERTSILAHAISSAILPKIAYMSDSEARQTTQSALNALIGFLTPVIIVAIFFVDWFFSVWISEGFSTTSALIAKILLFGFWFNALARMPVVFLQGRGRPNIIALCHLAEIIPYLILLYLGLTFYGLMGAAAVFFLRVFIDFLILTWLCGFFKSVLSVVIFPASLLALTVFVSVTNIGAGISIIAGIIIFCLSVINSKKIIPKEFYTILEKLRT